MKGIIPIILLVLVSCQTTPQNNPATGNRHTAAWKAARRFEHGVNLANCLEVSPRGHWSVPHTMVDLKEIRAEGFDHIRLPVGWHYYTGPGPEFKISGEIFDKVDYFVTNATKLGLNIIINIHDFNEFMTNPAGETERFYAIWRQVAAHYADAPKGVAFELLNEPHDAATTEIMNPIYAEAISEIRLTNPRRTIFIGPGHWNSASELTGFRVPEDDDNIIVTVHCYDPMFFTHQGASWVKPFFKLSGVHFPGPPETPLELDPDAHFEKWLVKDMERYNTLPADQNPCSPLAFMPKIEEAKAWSKEFGRPIHFGEFGAFRNADQPSRARYYAAMRKAFDDAGFGWAIWDWKSGFNYWNPKTHQPLPGMRQALFPTSTKEARQ